jgi:uncharacterized protein YbaP (TraB family)
MHPAPRHSPRSALISLLFAAAMTIPILVSAREPDTGKHFVWRVTNVPVPFYLIGTIHRLTGSDYPLPQPFQQALKDSQRFLFEVAENRKGEFGEKLAQARVYPKGDSIARHVHPETWAFLVKSFKQNRYFSAKWKVGGRYIEVQQLRPWAVANLYGGTSDWRGISGYYGVDNRFEFEAHRQGKEVAGLETVDEHVQVMGGMNDVESELLLLDEIVNRKQDRPEYDRTHAAWKRGDTAGLWAELQRSRKLNPGAEARLLDMRNVKWIPRIKAEMKTGKPTCILAGAGHFVGPNGVISLLQKNGYKIEQL